VTVYATNRGLKYPRYELENGVKVERFNCYAPGEAYYLSLEMLMRLRKVRFDVVHAHGYHAFPLHFSVLAECNRFVATPHFHGVGHSSFRNSLIRLARPFGRRTLEKADRIVAVSEYEKSLICQQFGFDSSRVTVVPNGVDFSEFLQLYYTCHYNMIWEKTLKGEQSTSLSKTGFLTMICLQFQFTTDQCFLTKKGR